MDTIENLKIKNLKIIDTQFAETPTSNVQNDFNNRAKSIMKTEEFIQLCDWAANNLDRTIVSIPKGTLFFRSFTHPSEKPANTLKPRGKKGRSLHFMNASPYGNFMIDVKRPQNRYAVFETTRQITAFNLLPLQLLLGKQLKGEKYAGGSIKYEDHWRGLFDFFNYSFLRRYFLRRGFDCVILTDKVDSPILTRNRFERKGWVEMEQNSNRVRVDDKVLIGERFWNTLTSANFQNYLCNSQFMFKIMYRGEQFIPIFPEFAMFSTDDDHRIPLKLYQNHPREGYPYHAILNFDNNSVRRMLDSKPKIDLGLPTSIDDHVYPVEPLYPGADKYPIVKEEKSNPQILNELKTFICNVDDCTKINQNIISNECDFMNVKSLSTDLLYEYTGRDGKSVYFNKYHEDLHKIFKSLQLLIKPTIEKLYQDGLITTEIERSLLNAMPGNMKDRINQLLTVSTFPNRPFDNPEFQNLFVIMYLKGGNAYRILLRDHRDMFPATADGQVQYDLMVNDLTKIMGKVSDFDNNLCLNPYLPKNVYNRLLQDMSDVLFNKILSKTEGDFRDFINYMNGKYRRNEESFKLINKPVTNNISTYGIEFTYGGLPNISVKRTKLSFIMTSDIDEFRGFELIRAMAQIPSTDMKVEKNGEIISLDCRPNFTAEIFDVSILFYNTTERVKKWKEAVTSLQDPTVFNSERSIIRLMDVHSAIDDLKRMTDEVILSGSYDRKQAKRLRRLNLFRWVSFYGLIAHATDVQQIYKYKNPEDAFRRTSIKINDDNIDKIRSIVNHIINHSKTQADPLRYLKGAFIPYFDQKKSLVQLINAFLSSVDGISIRLRFGNTDEQISAVFNYIMLVVQHKSENFLRNILQRNLREKPTDIDIASNLYIRGNIRDFFTEIIRAYPETYKIVYKNWNVQNELNKSYNSYIDKEYNFCELDVYVPENEFRNVETSQKFIRGDLTINVNYKVYKEGALMCMIETGHPRIYYYPVTFDYLSEKLSWANDNREGQQVGPLMGFLPIITGQEDAQGQLQQAIRQAEAALSPVPAPPEVVAAEAERERREREAREERERREREAAEEKARRERIAREARERAEAARLADIAADRAAAEAARQRDIEAEAARLREAQRRAAEERAKQEAEAARQRELEEKLKNEQQYLNLNERDITYFYRYTFDREPNNDIERKKASEMWHVGHRFHKNSGYRRIPTTPELWTEAYRQYYGNYDYNLRTPPAPKPEVARPNKLYRCVHGINPRQKLSYQQVQRAKELHKKARIYAARYSRPVYTCEQIRQLVRNNFQLPTGRPAPPEAGAIGAAGAAAEAALMPVDGPVVPPSPVEIESAGAEARRRAEQDLYKNIFKGYPVTSQGREKAKELYKVASRYYRVHNRYPMSDREWARAYAEYFGSEQGYEPHKSLILKGPRGVVASRIIRDFNRQTPEYIQRFLYNRLYRVVPDTARERSKAQELFNVAGNFYKKNERRIPDSREIWGVAYRDYFGEHIPSNFLSRDVLITPAGSAAGAPPAAAGAAGAGAPAQQPITPGIQYSFKTSLGIEITPVSLFREVYRKRPSSDNDWRKAYELFNVAQDYFSDYGSVPDNSRRWATAYRRFREQNPTRPIYNDIRSLGWA